MCKIPSKFIKQEQKYKSEILFRKFEMAAASVAIYFRIISR